MKVKWYVEDRYYDKSRAHVTQIDDGDLAECGTDEEKQELINQRIQNDFEKQVNWFKVDLIEKKPKNEKN